MTYTTPEERLAAWLDAPALRFIDICRDGGDWRVDLDDCDDDGTTTHTATSPHLAVAIHLALEQAGAER